MTVFGEPPAASSQENSLAECLQTGPFAVALTAKGPVFTGLGRVAERFKAPVLKTGRGFTVPRGFKSHPFRHYRSRDEVRGARDERRPITRQTRRSSVRARPQAHPVGRRRRRARRGHIAFLERIDTLIEEIEGSPHPAVRLVRPHRRNVHRRDHHHRPGAWVPRRRHP